MTIDERPHKMVNGEKVFLTDKEIEDRRAEELNWEINKRPLMIIAEVKAMAQKRIFDIAPEYKQRNMLAQAIELGAVPDNARTQAQKDEALALKSIWAKINDIRRHSDYLEEQIKLGNYPNLRDPASQGWPE